MQNRPSEGSPLGDVTISDEYTQKGPFLYVTRRLSSEAVRERNEYGASFPGKLCAELLTGECFATRWEAQVLGERGRR
jgi:hypothetical protein